jgi:hypothetical protein
VSSLRSSGRSSLKPMTAAIRTRVSHLVLALARLR